MGFRRIGSGLLVLGILVGGAPLATATPERSPGHAAMPSAEELTPRLAALARGQSGRAMTVAGQRDEYPKEGPGSLIETPRGVLVQVRVDHVSDSLLDAVAGVGARVTNVAAALGMITVEVPVASLAALAQLDGVANVSEVLEPMVASGSGVGQAAPADLPLLPCGSVISAGDEVLNARALRASRSVEGRGVHVGILSDSWDVATFDATNASADVATGDLPGPGNPCPGPGRTTAVAPVEEILFRPNGTDEGRAMAQLVHDLAPAATMSFRSAFNGMFDFAANITQLRQQDGADVIVDDVMYLDEPVFQQGPIAVAAEAAVADGATYVTAAGNDDIVLFEYAPNGSYEAPAFRPVACPSVVDRTFPGRVCHGFINNQPRLNLTLRDDPRYLATLHWAEPWFGVQTDLDFHVLGTSDRLLMSSTDVNPGGTERPFEMLGAEADESSRYLVISRKPGSTGTPRLKVLFHGTDLNNSNPNGDDVDQIDTWGPTIAGHAGAPSVITVGTTPVQGDHNGSHHGGQGSSRGPVTHYFGPVTSSRPARAMAPQVISKPDITAVDEVRTTFFFGPSHGFFGTSAAAPHVAAVAALLLECNPALTPAQLRGALQWTARPMGLQSIEKVGAGLLDARAAGDAACASKDTTGPTVSGLSLLPVNPVNELTSITVSATVTDARSLVGGAFVTVDGGEPQAMRATDETLRAAFDTQAERVEAQLGRLTVGEHQVCVTGSDGPGNVSGAPACGTVVVSERPIGDSEAPQVSGPTFSPSQPRSDQRVVVTASATDDTAVAFVTVKVGYDEPQVMFPTDGAYDSPSEDVNIELDPLRGGVRQVCVTVHDVRGRSNADQCSILTIVGLESTGYELPPLGPPPPPTLSPDTDRDGIPDHVERAVGADPSNAADNSGSVAAECPRSAVPAGRFADVGGVHAPAVDCASWYGWVLGRDGAFRPDDTSTREQIASILSRIIDDLAVQPLAGESPTFADIWNSVHEANIMRLAGMQIILGNQGLFFPRAPVSRAQIASLADRLAISVGIGFPDGPDAFSDDDGNVHEASINALAQAGVLRGLGPGRFGPDQMLNRGQLASVVVRFAAYLVADAGLMPPGR